MQQNDCYNEIYFWKIMFGIIWMQPAMPQLFEA